MVQKSGDQPVYSRCVYIYGKCPIIYQGLYIQKVVNQGFKVVYQLRLVVYPIIYKRF